MAPFGGIRPVAFAAGLSAIAATYRQRAGSASTPDAADWVAFGCAVLLIGIVSEVFRMARRAIEHTEAVVAARDAHLRSILDTAAIRRPASIPIFAELIGFVGRVRVEEAVFLVADLREQVELRFEKVDMTFFVA